MKNYRYENEKYNKGITSSFRLITPKPSKENILGGLHCETFFSDSDSADSNIFSIIFQTLIKRLN